MPQISAAKPQIQKRDRLLGAVFAGGKTILVSFARTFYALWLQITGLFFVLFTVLFASNLVRQYRANHFADRHRFWLTVGFLVVSLWFTLVSFRRANNTLKPR